MRRRQFITAVAGLAAAFPLPIRAQQRLPKIGFLSSASEKEWQPLVGAFFGGLRETGYVENRDVTIEYRWAEGRYERLHAFAAELVRSGADVIVAIAPPAARAAKAATTRVPVIFISGGDPVALKLVSSINRPGGNLTGITFVTADLMPKILQTLLQLFPKLNSVAILVNPSNLHSAGQVKDLQLAAQSAGLKAEVLHASTEAEIEKAMVQAKERGVGAVIVGTDPFFLAQKDPLINLPQRLAMPTVYNLREYVVSGGLISYGTSITDAYRQVGIYVGRVLKGAWPADLPILRPTKFELIINRKTAKTFGLSIPDQLLALADEVIE
jgi:putative ABC transport system substrate-binding protein